MYFRAMNLIGTYQSLIPYQKVEDGLILISSDEQFDEDILLPSYAITEELNFGETVDLFVYYDKEMGLCASLKDARICTNEVAMLPVKHNTRFGSFCDMGIEKDLLVPFREQTIDMEEGKRYAVFMYVDEDTERLAGTMKIEKHLPRQAKYFEKDKINGFVLRETEIGYSCVINNDSLGLLYKSEIFESLKIGDIREMYIKQVRPDGKIDLSLHLKNSQSIDEDGQSILALLTRNNGFTRITEKSDAQIIYKVFEMSKKRFKRALGNLYKQRIIELKESGIYLVDFEE